MWLMLTKSELSCCCCHNLFCWEKKKLKKIDRRCVSNSKRLPARMWHRPIVAIFTSGPVGKQKSAAAESVASALVFTHRPFSETALICVYFGSSDARSQSVKWGPLVCSAFGHTRDCSRCDQVERYFFSPLQILGCWKYQFVVNKKTSTHLCAFHLYFLYYSPPFIIFHR